MAVPATVLPGGEMYCATCSPSTAVRAPQRDPSGVGPSIAPESTRDEPSTAGPGDDRSDSRTHADSRPVRDSAAGRLVSGSQLGTYRILDMLGKGGMGEVYRAEDIVLGRQVALKVLSDVDTRSQQRFLREARLAASLKHPNITTIYQIGEHGGTLFIVLELISGGTLRELVQARGPLAPTAAARITALSASALHHAHRQGIVHRDIKPANLMLDNDGTLKVCDFGLARSMDDATELTKTGMLMGTPMYFSPEQCIGDKVGPPSDIYSLGCSLYFLLTGEPPWPNRSVPGILYMHVHEPLPDLTHRLTVMPPLLAAALRKSTAKKVADRYESAAEFAADLEAAAAQSERPAPRAPMIRRPDPPAPPPQPVIGAETAPTLPIVRGPAPQPAAGTWPQPPAQPAFGGPVAAPRPAGLLAKPPAASRPSPPSQAPSSKAWIKWVGPLIALVPMIAGWIAVRQYRISELTGLLADAETKLSARDFDGAGKILQSARATADLVWPSSDDAQQRLETAEADVAFGSALQRLRSAVNTRDWDRAIIAADEALKVRAGESETAQLKAYAGSMSAGYAGANSGDWAKAARAFARAATQRRNDPLASAEADFAGAMSDADAAIGRASESRELKTADWTEAAAAYRRALAVRSADPLASERKLYAEAVAAGMSALKARDWKTARTKFEDARTRERFRRLAADWASYAQSLELAAAASAAGDHAKARTLYAAVKLLPEHQPRLDLTVDPASATVKVDDRAVPTDAGKARRLLSPPPGRFELVVSSPGRPESRRSLTLPPGETAVLEIRLPTAAKSAGEALADLQRRLPDALRAGTADALDEVFAGEAATLPEEIRKLAEFVADYPRLQLTLDAPPSVADRAGVPTRVGKWTLSLEDSVGGATVKFKLVLPEAVALSQTDGRWRFDPKSFAVPLPRAHAAARALVIARLESCANPSAVDFAAGFADPAPAVALAALLKQYEPNRALGLKLKQEPLRIAFAESFDEAIAHVRTTVSSDESPTGRTAVMTHRLRLEGGVWRVVSTSVSP